MKYTKPLKWRCDIFSLYSKSGIPRQLYKRTMAHTFGISLINPQRKLFLRDPTRHYQIYSYIVAKSTSRLAIIIIENILSPAGRSFEKKIICQPQVYTPRGNIKSRIVSNRSRRALKGRVVGIEKNRVREKIKVINNIASTYIRPRARAAPI